MLWLRVLVCTALTLVAASGHAQPAAGDEMAPGDEARTEEARAAFERGVAAYEAGSFEEALVSFERAYELTGSPDILYNIGTVADRLRRDDVALEAYEGYLAARPDAEDRVNIEARIAAIRAAREAAAAAAGASVVTGSSESGTGTTGAVAPSDVAGAGAAEPVVGPSTAPTPSDPGAGPWVLVASGAAALAGGVALLVVAAVDLDSASRATTWTELSGPYDRVPLMTGIGWPLAGVGLAVLGAGLGWAIVGSGSGGGASAARSAPPARLRVTGVGVVVEGSF